MAAKSNLKNMVLCLFGTCLFCSAVLGGVYALTKEPIEQTNAKILQSAIGQVLLRNESNTDLKDNTQILENSAVIELNGKTYEYFTQVDSEGNPVAYAIKSTVVGFGGPLTLMVGISADRKLVLNTSVLAHSETPGLGAKCTSDEHFMEQWRGFDLTNKVLAVTKEGGSVDAITASTITSKAYTQAVSNALAAFDIITAGDASSDPVSGETSPSASLRDPSRENASGETSPDGGSATSKTIVEQEVEND